MGIRRKHGFKAQRGTKDEEAASSDIAKVILFFAEFLHALIKPRCELKRYF
jgi:hypothetical protein